MKIFIYIQVIFVCLFTACAGGINTGKPAIFVDTTKPFKKELPSYPNGGVDIFYELAKAKQKQLGLDSLESGFDNLQIRVWYDYALVRERKLVIITNTGINWSATVYDLNVDWDGQTETVVSKTIKEVTPKSGWANFSKKLLDLKVVTLPNQDNITGYGGGMDGNTYNVEIATKNQYRFYGYWEPQHNQQFWQAKNMTGILQLFEDELGV